MEDPKILIKKGYNIEVTSWENDADNYRTKTYTVETLEFAEVILKMCKELFETYHDGKQIGIGNMTDREDHESRIIQWVKKNPAIFKNKETIKDVYVVDYIMDLNYSLMGGSEYYHSRVFDKGCIYYSEKDVTVPIIKEATRFN